MIFSNEDAMKKFSEDGIPTKRSPLEVSESSDVIITMLPSSAHVSWLGFFMRRWWLTSTSCNLSYTEFLYQIKCLVLPGSFQVLDVYSGRNGLLRNGGCLGPWLYIDSSTVDRSSDIKKDIYGHVKMQSKRKERLWSAIIQNHCLKLAVGNLNTSVYTWKRWNH